MNEDKLKIIISGGGTGGHIFPAVAIANAIKKIKPDSSILFIGAEDRMEMQRVPQAGYEIIGLPIKGFYRKQLWKNIEVLWKILKSLSKAKKVIKNFQPDVVIGVGGFASGPTLKMAERLHIPTLIQEQNSYAGVTNKLLAKGASKICVAYQGMDRFFPAEKIILTGNPVRQDLLQSTYSKEDAKRSYNLDPNKPTVLIVGGSLGAQSINKCLLNAVEKMENSNIQYIWQTGKIYIDRIRKAVEGKSLKNIIITDFISDMAQAYAAADMIVSRAGAGSISEFCLLEKPVLLVPSPNVAEDHQTKNALALVNQKAALYVKDTELNEMLMPTIHSTITDKHLLQQLSNNIKTLALSDSANIIAHEILKLANKE